MSITHARGKRKITYTISCVYLCFMPLLIFCITNYKLREWLTGACVIYLNFSKLQYPSITPFTEDSIIHKPNFWYFVEKHSKYCTLLYRAFPVYVWNTNIELECLRRKCNRWSHLHKSPNDTFIAYMLINILRNNIIFYVSLRDCRKKP